MPANPPIRPLPVPPPDGKPALLVDKPLTERIASYRIKARLDVAKHEVVATETLRWKHTGSQPVDSVPLHLYLNAFKNEASVFMRESHGSHRNFKRADDGWGWIDVSSIQMDGHELRPGARYGEDETTLTVPLARPVAPGETLTLSITFTSHLPEVFARTGYKGDFMLIGQWFPKIGVLTIDDGAPTWHCDTFHVNSEFFADFGSYDVEITAPDTHVIAATGVLTAVADAGGQRTHTFRAEDVHDFVWMADPFMQVAKVAARSPHGPVEVRVYHRPAQAAYAARHLEAAKRTIERFSELFVAYPWPIMSVIDPPPDALGAGGMEYPTLVTTAGDIDADWQHATEFVTVHEVGHNWFQGMLASNEVDEAFLDEGINEYADGIVMDEWFGPDRSSLDGSWAHLGHYQQRRASTDAAQLVSPIATRSYEFAQGQYGSTTYNKTALAMKTLENIAGRERFLAAMRLYAQRAAFRHPTRADLFAALKEGLGGSEDWQFYLDQMFLGTGGVDFRVSSIGTRAVRPPRGVIGDGQARKTVNDKPDGEPTEWESWFSVMSRGKVTVPVEIHARFADGTLEHLAWDGRGGARQFELRRPSKLRTVIVDPLGKVPLEYEVLENAWTADSETGAAWRAAARASFWQQTLAQVVGL